MVEVVVNSKLYQIGCGAEEEESVKQAVEALNEDIGHLKQVSEQVSSLSQEHIFLYQLILAYTELAELRTQCNSLGAEESRVDSVVTSEPNNEMIKLSEQLSKLQLTVSQLKNTLGQN